MEDFKEYLDILNVLPDIVYKIDDQGNFLYISHSIRNLGYEPSDLIGKHFHVLIHPEDRDIVTRSVVIPRFTGKATGDQFAPKLFDERRTGNRGTKGLLVRLISKESAKILQEKRGKDLSVFRGEVVATGSELSEKSDFPFSTEDKPFYGEISNFGKYDLEIAQSEKRLMGTVGIIRDVTEKEALESEKEILRYQLSQAQKMEAIGQLAGGLAHDFNNLLQSISGCAERILLRSDLTRDQISKYAQDILGVTKISSNLTAKLLAFARKAPLKKEVIDINVAIEDISQLLSHTLSKNIHIEYSFKTDPALILGDKSQIQNCIVNLAINARDAMPEGGTLDICTQKLPIAQVNFPKGLPANPTTHYLCIVVRDTGKGMDSFTLKKIFDPFFTTKSPGKGTGLGLASVYGIVNEHGGWIETQSEVGVGTAFRIYLPSTEKELTVLEEPGLQNKEVGTKSASILLVDDEPMIREICAEMLKDLGFEVVSVSGANEAIQFYRENFNSIDLSIIDMVMPVMNGLDCFREFKQINPNAKAVLSTGYNIEGDSKKLRDEGVMGYLIKPFVSQKLFDVISRALD